VRVVVLALIVLLPLSACLAFAAGDVLVPHPWSKRPRHAGTSHDSSRAALKLPSAVTATMAPATPLPVLGALAVPALLAACSIIPRPPFVPPRA
jgi:hypothetical protein